MKHRTMKLPKKRLKKMQHKLIMTWDIAEGKEQEYFDFLVHTFVPRMNQLGFDLAEAWATIYGDCPQIMVTRCCRMNWRRSAVCPRTTGMS